VETRQLGGGVVKYFLFIYLQVHCHPFMEEMWPTPFVCLFLFIVFFPTLLTTKKKTTIFFLFSRMLVITISDHKRWKTLFSFIFATSHFKNPKTHSLRFFSFLFPTLGKMLKLKLKPGWELKVKSVTSISQFLIKLHNYMFWVM
jgi:hypothetical protein